MSKNGNGQGILWRVRLHFFTNWQTGEAVVRHRITFRDQFVHAKSREEALLKAGKLNWDAFICAAVQEWVPGSRCSQLFAERMVELIPMGNATLPRIETTKIIRRNPPREGDPTI